LGTVLVECHGAPGARGHRSPRLLVAQHFETRAAATARRRVVDCPECPDDSPSAGQTADPTKVASRNAFRYASRVRIAVLLSLLGACQCQSKAPGTGSGSASGTGSGSGSATAKKRSTLDITLPPLSGKPPKKRPAPLTAEEADELATKTFEDFSLELTKGNAGVAIRQRAKLEPGMSVNIFLAPCSETYKCRPMTVEAWKADEDKLKKALVDPDLVKRPDSIFEIGATTVGGAPAISIYQAGHFFGTDENKNPVSSYSLAYSIFYNDGVNFLRVSVNYSDDPTGSLAQMQTQLPRPFMEKVALAFVDAYGQLW
jgi:hypothetical protein